MLAAKHFDPVVGIDIHLIQPPGPVPPLPIPHPFVGFLIDPADYVPIIGSTVQINGMHRAQAGTAGKCVPPHIPIGGVFVPPPPGNECEMFMGSATVEVDGDAQSYMSLPALSCQSVGMPTIPRMNPKKKTKPKCLMLPLSFVLPIPAGPPVMIGGPPTISIMGMAMKAGLAGLGKLAKALKKLQKGSKRWKALSDKIKAAAKKAMTKLGIPPSVQNKVNRAICSVTGHPVDIATGKVFTDAFDIELPGPLPLRWERVWFSTSVYRGPLGHGWHHSYDLGLIVEEDAVVVRMADGRPVAFPPLGAGETSFERNERLTLRRGSNGYVMQDSSGLSWHFGVVVFDSDVQRLLSIRDRVGDRIQFNYNKYGRLEEIIDSADRRLPVASDEQGRITEIRGPHPENGGQTISLVSYEYDSEGRMVTVRDALSHPMSFRYDGLLMVRETDRNGLRFYFEYDGSDENARCIRTWGDGGIYNHRLKFDAVLKQTKVTNSLGQSTLHFWNDEGLVHRVVDALGNSSETIFNEFNQPVTEIDELGQTTTYAYDDRGNQILTVTADGAKLEFDYNELELPVRATDPLGKFWCWEYNEFGQPTMRKDATGRQTRFEYSAGRLAAIIDPAGNATRLSYDNAGHLDAVTSPDGGQSLWQYDQLGRTIAVTYPNGNVQRRERDLLGRVDRVIESDGNLRTFHYDPMGNITYIKDLEREVRLTYQGMGRLASRTEAGTSVSFSYNTEEDLIAVTNEHGHVYRFELDERRDVTREFGFDKIRQIYTRNETGRVIRSERASGLHTNYDYDEVGRVVCVRHSDGSKEKYVYNSDGRIIEAVNDTCIVRFERDASGRILKEFQNDNWVSSEYGELGLRTAMSSSIGALLSIERNSMGDVTGLEYRDLAGDPAMVVWKSQIQRDILGLELERTLPGGVRSRWERDKLGRPVRHQLGGAGGPRTDVKYEWGVNDRLERIIDAHRGATTFEHDELGNLTAATYGDGTVEVRMPDAVGNLFRARDRTDRKYGPAGELLEATTNTGRIQYRYDADGNLTSKLTPNGTWCYVWNASRKLIRAIAPDGHTVSFSYDAFSRRISKSAGLSTYYWVWDGNRPIHESVFRNSSLASPETTLSGNANSRDPVTPLEDMAIAAEKVPPAYVNTSVYSPDAPCPVAVVNNGQPFSVVADYLGTPSQFLDTNGQTTESYVTTIYGIPVDSISNASCLFGWPGHFWDSETGLFYNRFRYYDPDSGIYISQDPIHLRGGLRAYSYVTDPLRYLDVYGLASEEVSSLADRIAAADRAGSGMKPDPSHRAASFLTKAELEAGEAFVIKGGDGVSRELLQTPGQFNGKNGIYEFILDPDKGVTHQRFVEGGTISGVPNQRVKPGCG